MAVELSYVLITPHSLHKSQTGGIIARLITRTGLDLVGARMFAPSPELVQEYADGFMPANEANDRSVQGLFRDYIRTDLAPNPKTKKRRRVMLLLFQGAEAVRKLRSVIGTMSPDRLGGETIRDTFGDLVLDPQGQIKYFEPAVLSAPTPREAEAKLKLWARYSDTDGGLLEDVNVYPAGAQPQRTLVLIKPDNFRFPTGRPGNVIDFFSRTGLFIVAIKVHRMSVAQAVEFYGPVREILRTKFTELMGARARTALEKDFGFKLPSAIDQQLGQIVGPLAGENQFQSIVRFMSGRSPDECDEPSRNQPGTETCIALVYEGIEAVRKIRDVLGPTDPSKAPPGSIRREFGQSIMVNAAHASDSPENAQREMRIVKVAENNFRRVIEDFYGRV